MTQVHNSYVSRAVRMVYDVFFSSNMKVQPTFSDIYNNLVAELQNIKNSFEEPLLKEIVTSLEPYVTGVYDMFARQSNLDIHNRLVGFGLRNVPDSIWEPVMVTMMHILSQRLEHNQIRRRATHLVVDEGQVLCDRKSSSEQLLHAFETYRKFGGMATLLVQNLTRVLENSNLRDMYSNSSLKIFLDQGGVDVAKLSKIQELSEVEYKALEKPRKGRGVLICENEAYLFDASMAKDNPLYIKLSTDFHEKGEKEPDHMKENNEDAVRNVSEPAESSTAVSDTDTDTFRELSSNLVDLLTVTNGSLPQDKLKKLMRLSDEDFYRLIYIAENKGMIRIAEENGTDTVYLNRA